MDLDSHCLLQTDGLRTGVQHELAELNQILGNKNHDTENKAIQFNPAGIAAASTVGLSYGWLARRSLSRLPECRHAPAPPPVVAAEDGKLCKAGRHILTGAFKYITAPSERR